ncbi:MAG: hypothetical protein K2F81_05965 [Ruminococcus sp.]|nr:hypothetical protein [Ruminococcus sp.]
MQSSGLDKKYDVIRTKSTSKYDGKVYQYYSVSVSDKNNTNKFYYELANKIIIKGKIKDKTSAEKFLNSTLNVVLPAATNSITFANPFAGKVIKALVSGVLKAHNASLSSPTNLIVKSKNTYEITALTVETSQKYNFVLSGSTWYNVYNCNRAIWKIEHSIYAYKNKKLTAFHTIETLKSNGDYFKSYKAVQYFVENKKKNKGKYVNNSLYPYKSYFISDMIIKDSKGKKWVIKPIKYPTTTSLMSIV